MNGRVEVHLGRRSARRDPAEPFRILVLGDLSARGARGSRAPEALPDRRLLAVDVDTFDQALAGLAPGLELPLPSAGPGPVSAALSFRSIDDFHPEELWGRRGLFEDLADLRARLLDPERSAQAVTEVRAWAGAAPETPRLPSRAPTPEPAEEDSDTLERLLGGRPAGARDEAPARPEASSPRVDLSGFLRAVVTPEIAPETTPHLPLYLQAVDDAIAERMRALLHHPAFQDLEALWRSVHGLVTGLELGQDLQLHLLDVTAEELAADLLRPETAPEDTALFRLLVERHGPESPDGTPWAALVGAYGFGPGAEDLRLLEALGTLAARAGGPFLAQALPALLGCPSPSRCADPATWQALGPEEAGRLAAFRGSQAARWVGLALPRVLLRLPYGRATDEVEGFDFEELTPARKPAPYLWGSPAFPCARLLAEAFQEKGWSMEPGDLLEVGDLPAYAFTEGGEARLQPCAEVVLPERASLEILRRGPMPVVAFPGRNAVRLLRFQSVADPPAPLPGPWG